MNLSCLNHGDGDWGLGIGDWGLGTIPNTQSPIPNPQSPIPNPHILNCKITKFIYTKYYLNTFIFIYFIIKMN